MLDKLKDSSVPPLPGMKVIPLYYGSDMWEILYGGAWCALLEYALAIPEHCDAFEKESGHSLKSLVPGNALEIMIDKATGRTDAIFGAWCDWVTVNLWGVEGGEQPEASA